MELPKVKNYSVLTGEETLLKLNRIQNQYDLVIDELKDLIDLLGGNVYTQVYEELIKDKVSVKTTMLLRKDKLLREFQSLLSKKEKEGKMDAFDVHRMFTLEREYKQAFGINLSNYQELILQGDLEQF